MHFRKKQRITKVLKREIGTKPEDVQGNLPVYHANNKGRMIATTAMFVGLVNIMLEDAKNDRREMADICIPFLDDVIVFSRTFEEHVEHVRTAIRRLRQHGVKLKAKKCKLFKREVHCLGRVVSEQGCKMDPSNI